jgi:predicted DNA-binding transcriptional regulator YafY
LNAKGETKMEIKTIHKKSQNRVPAEKYEELVKKLHKDHDKLVKGKFEFTDAQGGWFEFAYRYFKEDLLTTYRFVHGEVTEIPIGLAKHLNNTVRKVRKFGLGNAERGGELPNRGLPSSYEVQSRVKFIPVEMF